MAHERNIGVTEARFGLTLITCLLFLLGYAILHRLGANPTPQVDYRPSTVVETEAVPANVLAPAEEQPQVLTIEETNTPSAAMHTSLRPDDPESEDAQQQQR